MDYVLIVEDELLISLHVQEVIERSGFLPRMATVSGPEQDGNAELIASTLWNLIEKDKLAIPRGGYLVRRGRVIVESATTA